MSRLSSILSEGKITPMIVLKAVEAPERSERRPGRNQKLLLQLEEEGDGSNPVKRSMSTQRSALAKVEARVHSIREK